MTADGLPARRVALRALGAVLDRRAPLDDALDESGLAALESRDRAFARLLTLTALRRHGQIEALIGRCLDKPLKPGARAVGHVLAVGAAQLLFLDTPPHAAIDTSVRLMRAAGRPRFAGLVNAVLRRLARDGAAWRDQQDAARLNTPDWLWRSWLAAYGETAARAIAAAHAIEPPLDLTPREDAEIWAERLGASVLPTGTLRLAAGGRIEDLPGFAEGAWWVQDAAAAMPARLLGSVEGQRIADLCAAPGGKTAQLAAAGARVIAVDRSADRLERLRANLARLGLEAESVAADAAAWRPASPVDAVLLDAPCTATGTIRRHPDIAYAKRPRDIAAMIGIQDRLLAAAIDMVRPGGLIVYATCSLQPEEGPERIAALSARGAPVAQMPIAEDEIGGLDGLIADGALRSLPCHWAERGGLDGFFAARLRRI